MYKTTRDIVGGTLMTCTDCGHAISMNKMCENPIQAATDILKHMAAHNAARAFAPVGRIPAEEADSVSAAVASLPPLPELQWIAPSPQLPN